MIEFMDYLRRMLCRHEWETEERHVKIYGDNGKISKQGDKVYMFCIHCGHHKNHWKYLDGK